MKKVFIWVCVILFLTNISIADIGVEPYGDKWKAWNNGSIANETFFWLEDDKLQLANYDTAFDWVTYSAGFWFTNNNGTNVSIGLFDQDYVEDVSSNNVSWWRGRWKANFSYGNKDGNLTNRIGQFLNDDFVSYEVKLETGPHPAWDDFNKTVNFWRRMSDIDISDNGVADRLLVSVNNNTFDVSLNRTTNTSEYLLTGQVIRIYDPETLKMVEWGMTDYGNYSIKLIANPGRNADVYWYRHGVVPQANRTYSLLHLWIDDTVQYGFYNLQTGYLMFDPLSIIPYSVFITSSPKTGWGCNPRLDKEYRAYTKFNKTQIKETLPAGYDVKTVSFYHSPLQVSTPGPVDWRTNFYDAPMGATLDTGDWGLGNFDIMIDWPSSPDTRIIDLGAGAVTRFNAGTTWFTVKMADASLCLAGQTWDHTMWKMKLQLYYTYPKIDLTAPIDKTMLNDTINWANFTCNWSFMQPDNITLFLNYTANNTHVSTDNYTENVSFDYYFEDMQWTCQTCKDHDCNNASTWGFSHHPVHNVTIEHPINGTTYYNSSISNVTCGCNGWPCIWVRVYINGVLNFSGSYMGVNNNASQEVSFDPGEYNITCRGYHEYWPGYYTAWNEPVTIWIEEALAEEEDDFIAIITLFGIIVIAFIFIIYYGGKNVQNKNSQARP